ncbi:MAG: maleylpyruvate isomerase N-terminal domain-containing protein [Chloroflexi bacterium]|nr:maleylpyruvate isomerase N-terminal domain-containing protein [Chloroflexota bacterium]
MPLPQVEAAVEDLQHSHRELLRVVDALSPDDWDRYVPHGEWTVKDLIAHVIGDMSPSGAGLIHAGVLTPEFIAETSRGFDTRTRNESTIDERRHFGPESLRQLLFESDFAFIDAALRLDDRHLEALGYAVPMGPGYELKVIDWLWRGYHYRQHIDDIKRTLESDYTPEKRTFLPEIEEKFRVMVRGREGFLRAVYSVADDAWDEKSIAAPEWTNKDILAHVAANDLRPHARLSVLLGEGDDDQLAAVNSTVDEWNQARVDERRDRTVTQLIAELDVNRSQTFALLSRIEPKHLDSKITLADGRTLTVVEYIGLFGEHESIHAGQLVPASRARRTK